MIQSDVDIVILSEVSFGMRTAGAYRLATEIRQADYSCQIVDFFSHLQIDDLMFAITACVGKSTKVVGISTTFTHGLNPYQDGDPNRYLKKIDKIFNHIKQINSNTKIVVGGANVLVLNHKLIDVLATGYADKSIVSYLKWLDGKNPFLTYSINANNKIVLDGNTHNTSFNFNSSAIEYIAHDNIIYGESLVLEIARGCIFKCSFCNYPLNGKKKNDYIKHRQTIYNELIKNYYEHGTTNYIIADDTHNDTSVKLAMLADVKQSLPFNFEYTAYIRLELLRAHPEQYTMLKDAGLIGALFGIESLNYESSKAVGKGLRPDKVEDELHKFKALMPQCSTEGSFIAGLPYETTDTITEWSKRLLSLDYPLDNFTISPLTIDTSDKKIFKSEFDLNWQKYYTMDNGVWHNGNFDRKWAASFSSNIAIKCQTIKRNRVGGFAATIIKNLGIPLTDDRRIPESNVISLKVLNKVNNYRNILLNTPYSEN
jgi:hypothetical protein